jgi:hypothetical protein
MSAKESIIATYLIKGVKTSTRGDVIVNNKNTSLYSMYPHSSRTRYNFEALLAILNKYKEQIKPDNHAENVVNYQKCISELDDTPIGIFINHDKAFPFKWESINNSSEFIYIRKVFETNQTIFDELYDSTITKKKVAKPVVTATAAATAVTKTETATTTINEIVKTEPVTEATEAPVLNKYEENSVDFDTTKWQKHVTDFEATKPALEAEIKTLEEALATKFDIVTSNRLKKRQRTLAAYPATLAILKANVLAKQNYYTDGLQADYKTDQASINVDLQISYFHPGGHTLLTTNFNTPNRISHLARNPALFLKVDSIVKDCRKKVNRLRVNKADKETGVQALEAVFETIKAEVVKSKYYVNIPADN